MKPIIRTAKFYSRSIGYQLISYEDLDEQEELLFERALRGRSNAQAPYSNYKVGAAVLSNSGSIYIGCNVECADYQALHAEVNAIGSMVTWDGSAKIKKLAFIGAPAEADVKIREAKVPEEFYQFVNIPVPCGGCLQKIWENCHGDGSVSIYSFSQALGCITRVLIRDVLPFKFGPQELGVNYSK